MLKIDGRTVRYIDRDFADSKTEDRILDEIEITQFLSEPVDPESSCTLNDIFAILDSCILFKAIFPRFSGFCEEYWKTIEDVSSLGQDGYDDPIVQLVLSHNTSYHYSDVSYDLINAGDNKLDFEEVDDGGFEFSDHYIDLSGKGESGEVYSISLSPIECLLNIPVSFDIENTIAISKRVKGEHHDTVYKTTGNVLSLYECVNAIIDDITFHGSNEDKCRIIDELKELDESITTQGNNDESSD